MRIITIYKHKKTNKMFTATVLKEIMETLRIKHFDEWLNKDFDSITMSLEEWCWSDGNTEQSIEELKNVYKKNYKYYVDFENTEDQNPFCLQSMWFNTKEEAIKWYIKSFDFVQTDTMVVSVMKSIFDEDGNFGDIEFVEDITEKFNLRSDIL